jgi:hypothetical protein
MQQFKRILNMDKTPKYQILENMSPEHDTCPIQILEGEFKDIVYKYGKISLNEIEGGQLAVTMDITLLSGPENFDQTNKEFTQTVGEIFVSIVEKEATADPLDLEDDVHQDKN